MKIAIQLPNNSKRVSGKNLYIKYYDLDTETFGEEINIGDFSDYFCYSKNFLYRMTLEEYKLFSILELLEIKRLSKDEINALQNEISNYESYLSYQSFSNDGFAYGDTIRFTNLAAYILKIYDYENKYKDRADKLLHIDEDILIVNTYNKQYRFKINDMKMFTKVVFMYENSN